MRAIIKRVQWAKAQFAGQLVAQIEHGLLVQLGVVHGDGPAQAHQMADRIRTLKVFDDPRGTGCLTVQDVRGGVLAVSSRSLQAAAGTEFPVVAEKSPRPIATMRVCQAFMSELRGLGCQAAGVFSEETAVESMSDAEISIFIEVSPAGDSCLSGSEGNEA